MSFGNLVGLLMGDPSSSLVSAGSQLGSPAEKGTVRNLVSRLAGLLPTEMGAPLDISANVPGAAPPISPMGKATSDSMAGYTPGDVGDPQATNLDPVQKSLLNAISTGESNGRYDVRYTPKGGMRFTDFTKHPGIFEPGPEGPSSAAGRYQFTKSTWDSLGGGPFDPTTQDIRGWQLAEKDYRTRTGRDLGDDLKAKGFTPDIARSLSDTWTSFRNPSVVKQAQMVFERSRKKYEGTTQTAGDVVPFPSPGNEFFNADGTPKTFEEITDRANKRLTNERLMKSLGGGQVIPFNPAKQGVGPDAAPGLGGPKLPPFTDATPEQHGNFASLVSTLAPNVVDALNRWKLNGDTWMREQNALAFPAPFGDNMSPEEKRAYGEETLKREMLKRLGVDNVVQGPYNDQPTEQQKQRSPLPNENFLKELEAEMEFRTRTGRQPKRKPYKNADRNKS